MFVWEKVFKNGPGKICGMQPLKNLKGVWLLKQTVPLQILKAHAQMLLGPFFNTFFHFNFVCFMIVTKTDFF